MLLVLLTTEEVEFMFVISAFVFLCVPRDVYVPAAHVAGMTTSISILMFVAEFELLLVPGSSNTLLQIPRYSTEHVFMLTLVFVVAVDWILLTAGERGLVAAGDGTMSDTESGIVEWEDCVEPLVAEISPSDTSGVATTYNTHG